MANNSKNLADKILNTLLDMDFVDYTDTTEKDLQSLENDIELLKKQGSSALLNAIEMLLEN